MTKQRRAQDEFKVNLTMKSANLVSAIGYLGFKPTIGDQDWRIWIQEVAYILKSSGFNIDFEFIKHYRGPFSRDLQREYFQYRYAYENLQSNYILTEEDVQILEMMRRSVNLLSLPRLEGVASALLAIGAERDWDEKVVMKELSEWKTNLPEEELILAIDDAKKILFKDEFLSPELKAELSAWENIGVESANSSASLLVEE